jgi:glycosyltransferase involved in cell wall biosynthesis
LKVSLINTLSTGGAANACIRLYNGLLVQQVESSLIYWSPKADIACSIYYHDIYQDEVLSKISNRTLLQKGARWIKTLFRDDWEIKTVKQRAIHNHISETRPKGYEVFTFPFSPYPVHKHALVKKADIIHLHWINNFIDYPSFFSHVNKPIVWTLHEMNPFTGGCSYDYDCKKYLAKCNDCPQLTGTGYEDYAAKILRTKLETVRDKNITVVAPSKWLMNLSANSKVLGSFPHHLIPYGIDESIFKPTQTQWIRKHYNIDPDKKILLFVSASVGNMRKGAQYMYDALDYICEKRNDVEMVAVGNVPEKQRKGVKYTGNITDERIMARIYSGSDLFVIPSLADNLPNTVIESLMCGTPVVGFDKGGVPEMIDSGVNGEVCKDVNHLSLSKSILRSLGKEYNRQAIADDAKSKYAASVQAKAYICLYNEILNRT